MEEHAVDPKQLEDQVDSEYANNVYLEPSVWDLKLIFGEYSGRKNGVDWHTSITIPWAQAKLLMYYLGVNIAIHELGQNSPTSVPTSMIPPPPPEPDPGSVLDTRVYDFVVQYHQRFLDSLSKTPSV